MTAPHCARGGPGVPIAGTTETWHLGTRPGGTVGWAGVGLVMPGVFSSLNDAVTLIHSGEGEAIPVGTSPKKR